MKSITDRLIQTAAYSRRFLEGHSRDRIGGFILSHQHPDGGFRGRSSESDLYYTVFAVAGLKALGDPIPVFKVWKYVRSFGLGDDLDRVHLVCLIRLKTAFRMFGITRRRLLRRMEKLRDDSAYGLFLRLLAEERTAAAELPEEPVRVPLSDPTTNLAASLLLNRQVDDVTIAALRGRVIESGGFAPTDRAAMPDLLSTATALFALTEAGAPLDGIQEPCLRFVESLWRDSGGFAGHPADEFEDVEYTFYALLSIGALIRSLAKNYGTNADSKPDSKQSR
jgi:prenyltransferase beta subunit